MATGEVLKRIAIIALAMLAMSAADAQQRKRLPSRTEPIPDTETGRPAASTEPPNPSMMIYGPPVTPLGAPPEATKPAPVAAPKPAPAPEPVAAPAPAPKPEPAPVAIPAPAPKPEPIAVPKPPVEPAPPPVAAPAPKPELPPAPVAIPAPVRTPPPVVSPVQEPRPPIAVPTPAPEIKPAAPVIAAPAPAPASTPEPQRAPIVAPQPIAKPVPERREVVAAVRPSAPAAPKLDDKFVERIFACLSPGLPSDWRRAWIVVTNVGGAGARKLESQFFYTTSRRDEDAESLVPCSAQDITERIAALPAARQDWKSAKLLIDSEGEFDLKYEY
jgi:hypothetical protein